MRSITILGCALLVLVVTASGARADDPCLGDEEAEQAKAAAATLAKAEQAGKPAELFMAYRSILGNECVDRYDKHAWARAKANLPKLGRDLAKAAEAKGLWYSATRFGRMGGHRPFATMKRLASMPKPTAPC